jgi:ubiquinone/menaquinone biosynthesis C-methylase UbiE
MSQLAFDDDTAQRLEAVYRIRDAIRRRRLVREALRAAPGERILDVGCGPGFYCAELAEEVGPSGSIVGLDTSAPMLALAARRCESDRNVELREGDAGSLPVDQAASMLRSASRCSNTCRTRRRPWLRYGEPSGRGGGRWCGTSTGRRSR